MSTTDKQINEKQGQKTLKEKEQRLEKFREDFKERFINPQIAGTVNGFQGSNEEFGGLWVSGESGNEIKEDIHAFDYYAESNGDYDCGIHEDARKWLEEHDAYAAFNDAGTVMIYLNDD